MKILQYIVFAIGFATDLIERGATIIQVKELLGHSNIRSTMEYIHLANIDMVLESPIDALVKTEAGINNG